MYCFVEGWDWATLRREVNLRDTPSSRDLTLSISKAEGFFGYWAVLMLGCHF